MAAANGGLLRASPTALVRGGQGNFATNKNWVVPDGLIAYYGFDTDCMNVTSTVTGTLSGAILDLTNSGFYGNLDWIGSNVGLQNWNTTLGPVGANCSGNALQYMQTPGTVSTTTNPISISLWLNAAATLSSFIVLGGTNDFNVANSGWVLYGNPTNALTINIGDQSTGGTIVAPNLWNHFAAAGAIGQPAIGLLNGVVVSSASNITSIASSASSHLTLFARPVDQGFKWNGQLDDVRIYNRYLSVADMMLLYQAGLEGRRATGPFMNIPFVPPPPPPPPGGWAEIQW